MVKKKKYSLKQFSEAIGYAKDFKRAERAPALEARISNMLLNTKQDRLSPAEILVYGLCEAMKNSSEPVWSYTVPVELTKKLLATVVYYQGYISKDEFIHAPISGTFIMDNALHSNRSIILETADERRGWAAFSNSADYAVAQKLFSKFDANKHMSAKKFIKEFGNVEGYEIPEYYRVFASTVFKYIEIWEKSKLDRAKLDSPIEKEQKDEIFLPNWLFDLNAAEANAYNKAYEEFVEEHGKPPGGVSKMQFIPLEDLMREER